jgi:DNA-binding MarR family transcriptional regulator
MSAFEERPPFKKRIVSASLTEEQRHEFDAMKAKLHIETDGALIKRALADLSHATLEVES